MTFEIYRILMHKTCLECTFPMPNIVVNILLILLLKDSSVAYEPIRGEDIMDYTCHK